MAKQVAVWGIDIGQSALKALRCRAAADGKIEADAFDYIEYSKILSQPDAGDPADLIHEALQQFLSRNSVRGDKVVMSVSGQNGLARFIKLPPVETSKIPDIVRYEARQQIPFPLEDVVWDYQQLAGGSMDEGFALEAEVGLFAMKREQAYKVMKPFDRVDVEVDVIQLTPLALYNFICQDQLPPLKPDEYDPDSPPPSVVVLSLGTDTTDLVVTNGYRVWQRSIPVGGNHFTKALTKELKLNFATAEHMKRNASAAADPKALFQAMRPVFNELLSEVQRSLGYFKNMDRKATLGRVVALGNVMRLPGLQRYLAQNLGYELTKVDGFKGLIGSGVVDAPAFKENLLAFGVCYGLALQGLKLGKIDTNLLPPEIAQYRMIRAKKPWALAAAALLLMGCTAGYFQHFRAVKSVSLDPTPSAASYSFAAAKSAADDFIRRANQWDETFKESRGKFAKADEVGRSMLQNVAGRDRWMKLLKAVNLCLPRNESERPKDIAKRNEIKIDTFECRYVEKLEDWYAVAMTHNVLAPAKAAAVPAGDPNNPAPADPNGTPPPMGDPNALPVDPNAPIDPNAPPADPNAAAIVGGPTGPGWVFKVMAHHYHNEDPQNQGTTFVRNTLLKNLEQEELPIPPAERADNGPKTFPIKKQGIEFPVMIGKPLPEDFNLPIDDDGEAGPQGAAGVIQPGIMGQQARKTKVQRRLNFSIEFCWRPPQAAAKAAIKSADAPPPVQ